MAISKTFWATSSTLPVALLTGWQDARLLASIERLMTDVFITFSSFVASLGNFSVWFALQGTGHYSVYVANYARGNIGPHVLLEMDEAASDVTRGIVALSDVAAEAGVNKLTGKLVSVCVVKSVRLEWFTARLLAVQGAAVWSLGRSSTSGGLTCSAIMRTGKTSCSRITEMGLLSMWPSKQASITWCHSRDVITVTFSQLWNHKTALFSFAEQHFTAVWICKGVADQYQHGRGVALADFNGDGRTDIVYGNWNGPHRLFLQGSNSAFRVRAQQQSHWQVFDKVPSERVLPSRTLRPEDLPLPLLSAQSSLPTLTMTRSWRCFSTIFSTDKALRTEFSGNTIV